MVFPKLQIPLNDLPVHLLIPCLFVATSVPTFPLLVRTRVSWTRTDGHIPSPLPTPCFQTRSHIRVPGIRKRRCLLEGAQSSPHHRGRVPRFPVDTCSHGKQRPSDTLSSRCSPPTMRVVGYTQEETITKKTENYSNTCHESHAIVGPLSKASRQMSVPLC